MAKSKGKDKKAAKPAKGKSKPVAKKVVKPAKKAAPKAKKVVKPVKKAKPIAKKVVKAKPVVKKKVIAKVAKPAKKVAPKAVPVIKQVVAPVKAAKPEKAPKEIKPLKPKKESVKRILKDDVKPFVKQLYKQQPVPQEPDKSTNNVNKKKPMEDLNLRYSDKELKEFKDLIDNKLSAAREELKNLKEALENHTDSQAGNKAWNMEEGTDTSEMEYLMNQISRQHQYIRNLELALVRIENKTYGICRVTGKLIPKERLRIVPHATLSLEAKNSRKTDENNQETATTTAPPADFAEGFED